MLTERIYNHLGIAAEQMKDDTFLKIIRALEPSDSLNEIDVDPDDHRAALLRKHLNQFFSGTRHLCSNDKGQ